MAKWKKALESKKLKLNVNIIKATTIAAKSSKEVANDIVDLCRICGKRVMRNSIQCQNC